MHDTICAVSSGRPPAAIAVVRLSGPAALTIATALCGSLPAPRTARLRALRDGAGALLDRALVLVFPGPATATGEDLVEFHCHGGRAVVTAVEGALIAAGARAAMTGEFTRQALTNGRIDLAEAEGLADLLEAETEAQRRAALDAAEGRVSGAIGAWIARIAILSAQVEAGLDFADEDDVGDAALPLAQMVALAGEIDAVLAAPPVERLRDGLRVVIAGPPNAGKSTLLNALVQRDAAIISPIAGTTRDRIEVQVVRGGVAYALTDTAGLTETADPVEAIGVARAGEAIVLADILLWLGDDTPPHPDAIGIHPRADLPGREVLPADKWLAVRHDDPAMIDALWSLIADRAATLLPAPDRLLLRRHQRDACAEASTLLRTNDTDPLIVAEHLRLAHRALGTILGIDATEVMLDTLFGRFCIGK